MDVERRKYLRNIQSRASTSTRRVQLKVLFTFIGGDILINSHLAGGVRYWAPFTSIFYSMPCGVMQREEGVRFAGCRFIPDRWIVELGGLGVGRSDWGGAPRVWQM